MTFQVGHKINVGRKRSKETILKMSLAKKGKKFSEKHCKKISLAHKKLPKERHPMYGKKHSEESKEKMSLSQKIFYRNGGKHNRGMLGKKHTKEWKNKMSERNKGNKNPAWLGGISFEPYSIDWTKTLRRSIRERDYYTCQICKEPQKDEALNVHHIDYNKKNCDPNNLITLCNSCHQKTNFNRKYWLEFFNNY